MDKRTPRESDLSRRNGSFTDAPDLLLPLFADPDGRGGKRWREVFGMECRRPRFGGPFVAIAPDRRRSEKP